MNDFNDGNQTQNNFEAQPGAPSAGQPASQSASQPAGFCQHCGRPLTTDSIRRVGQAVYCEPCLAARLNPGQPGTQPGTQPGAQPGSQPGYTPVDPAYTQWAAASALAAPGPNPGLAALLGLIPGVGAMYNEQYAKGIVHLVVFAVLVSLSDNVNGIFGLFVAGWVFYMAIEAHHTARARRDGTPLPNPFGLNDIGERLGFGKSWPSGPSVAEVANDAAAAAAAATAHATAGFNQQPPYQTPPVTPPWGAAPETYSQTYTQPPYTQPAQPYAQAQYTQPFVDAAYNQAYRDAGYGPVPPTVPFPGAAPYSPIPPAVPAIDPNQRNRFPAGAVWLIGLGTLFLLATTGIFSDLNFRPEAVLGTVLIGLALWIFLARMTSAGASLVNDHTPGYIPRLLNALMSTLWLALLGILFLLDGCNLFGWHHSWPLLIILPGVIALIRRAYDQTLANSYVAAVPAPATPVTSTTDHPGGSL